jgi:flagellar biosynthesis GTPase FlhF
MDAVEARIQASRKLAKEQAEKQQAALRKQEQERITKERVEMARRAAIEKEIQAKHAADLERSKTEAQKRLEEQKRKAAEAKRLEDEQYRAEIAKRRVAAATRRAPMLTKLRQSREKTMKDGSDVNKSMYRFIDCCASNENGDGETLVADMLATIDEHNSQLGRLPTRAAQYSYLASPILVAQISDIVDQIALIRYDTLKCTAISTGDICKNKGQDEVSNLKKLPLAQIEKVLDAYTRSAHKLLKWWFTMLDQYAAECKLPAEVAHLKSAYNNLTRLLHQNPEGPVSEGFFSFKNLLLEEQEESQTVWKASTFVLALVAGGLGWLVYKHHSGSDLAATFSPIYSP